MQVTAQLNNLRIAPRKVRLIARAIKGMNATSAKHQLVYIVKKSSGPISKLLDSALANAHANFNMDKDNLFIKDIIVNEGPKLKRFRPKGFGMASPIEKKTSHIRIILDERVPGLKSKVAKENKHEHVAHKPEEKEITAKPEKNEKIQKEKLKPEIKREMGQKGGIAGQVGKIKKMFRRKVV